VLKWIETPKRNPVFKLFGKAAPRDFNVYNWYKDYKKEEDGSPKYSYSSRHIVIFDGRGNVYSISFSGGRLHGIVKFDEDDIVPKFDPDKLHDLRHLDQRTINKYNKEFRDCINDLFILKKTGGKNTREEVNAAKAPRNIKPNPVVPEGIPTKQDELISVLSRKGLECIDKWTGNYWDIDDHDSKKFGDSQMPEIGFATQFAETASKIGKKCYATFTEDTKYGKPRGVVLVYLGGDKIYCIESKEMRGKMVLSEWSHIRSIVGGKAVPDGKRLNTVDVLNDDILPNL
jgi:hypothetical protein